MAKTYFTTDHEWLRVEDGVATVGITDYAQTQLGDVVFVQLPEVGEQVNGGQPVGEIESTKSVSDLFAPVSGEILARNESLDEHPELINSDPYGEGWMIEVKIASPDALDELVDADEYRKLTEQA